MSILPFTATTGDQTRLLMNLLCLAVLGAAIPAPARATQVAQVTGQTVGQVQHCLCRCRPMHSWLRARGECP